MVAQIGNPMDVELLRDFCFHPEGVGVVKAEGTTHANAVLGQGLVQVLSTAKDLLLESTGIFGIDVDLAIEQGFPENLGATELAPVFGPGPRAPRSMDQHLAQDYRLGQLLRAHSDLCY